MNVTEALKSAQFVTNRQGEHTAALPDIQAWESLISLDRGYYRRKNKLGENQRIGSRRRSPGKCRLAGMGGHQGGMG